MDRKEYMKYVDEIYELLEGIPWTDETLEETYHFLYGLQSLIYKHGENMDSHLMFAINTTIIYFLKYQIEKNSEEKINVDKFKDNEHYLECLFGDWLEAAHSKIYSYGRY